VISSTVHYLVIKVAIALNIKVKHISLNENCLVDEASISENIEKHDDNNG